MEINSVIISTVDREPEYIHQTLASLGLSLKTKKNIYLVVDGPNYKHYALYSSYFKIYLHQNESRFDTNKKRAAVNYGRCLALSRQLGGFNLILEDDIFLFPNWLDVLSSIEINEDVWLLSLNSLQNLNRPSKRGYEEFIVKSEIPQKVWCRSYAVVYSPKILNSLPELLVKTSLEMNLPYDIALGAIFYKSNFTIYECVSSLVKHLGEKSCMVPGEIR